MCKRILKLLWGYHSISLNCLSRLDYSLLMTNSLEPAICPKSFTSTFTSWYSSFWWWNLKINMLTKLIWCCSRIFKNKQIQFNSSISGRQWISFLKLSHCSKLFSLNLIWLHFDFFSNYIRKLINVSTFQCCLTKNNMKSMNECCSYQ